MTQIKILTPSSHNETGLEVSQGAEYINYAEFPSLAFSTNKSYSGILHNIKTKGLSNV